MNRDKSVKTDAQKIREILDYALLIYNYYHKRDPWMTLSLDVLPDNLYGRYKAQMDITEDVLCVIASIVGAEVNFYKDEVEVRFEPRHELATGIRKSASIDFDNMK